MKPLLSLKRGQIYDLLEKSYLNWSQVDQWKTAWLAYDNDVFDHPQSIGVCGAVTFVNDVPIGFISWDPRNHPAFAIIGHNCILPAYRGQGYGKRQILYACRAFAEQGFKLVRVSTGTDAFFKPARKMYESAGFLRTEAYWDDGPDMVYYEMCYASKSV